MSEVSSSHFLELIEELNERVRTLEERLEHTWEGCRPSKTGGTELPENDEIVKNLAFDLKSARSEITDIKRLHMVDTTLHLLSVWPVLAQECRHYAFNMAKLLYVATNEGWNEAVQQSNGFSLQLTASMPNGHQSPAKKSSSTASGNGVVKVEATESMTTNGVQEVPEPLSNVGTSPQKMTTEPGTSTKRVATDEVPTTPPKKVASGIAPTPTKLTPGTVTGTASPLSYKPKCSCKQAAFRLQVRKENQNQGRYFYKCWKCCITNPNNPCNYFQWEDELPERAPKSCSHCGKPGHNKSNCPAK